MTYLPGEGGTFVQKIGRASVAFPIGRGLLRPAKTPGKVACALWERICAPG